MTQTEWAHLPNAKHIDWVIASLKANPKKWYAARTTAWDAAVPAAWDAAWDAVYNEAWRAANNAAWAAAYDVANEAAWLAVFYAARDAIVALIAYDDCAYMIESEIDEIKILAKLGDPRAILLLPACIVYNETSVLRHNVHINSVDNKAI